MINEDYISKVKVALCNSNKLQAIHEIVNIPKPENAEPLIALIHGDCRELESAITYAEEYDPAHPSSTEIEELASEKALSIIAKIQQYLADWDKGNYYSYTFELKAQYGRFKDEHGAIESIKIIKTDLQDIKTVKQVIKAAKEWESVLLERVVFYPDQEVGHKRSSIYPTYEVRDRNYRLISYGQITGDDDDQICTWQNNVR